MRTIISRTACAALIALLVHPAALAQKRGFIATDYYKEIVPGDVAMSPAGDLVAFTVTTVVEKENRRHREVWVARSPLGQQQGGDYDLIDGPNSQEGS